MTLILVDSKFESNELYLKDIGVQTKEEGNNCVITVCINYMNAINIITLNSAKISIPVNSNLLRSVIIYN